MNKKYRGYKPSEARLKNPDLFNYEIFFEKLATESTVQKETVLRVYGALVKILTREIKRNGLVRVPHLGDFVLTRVTRPMGTNGPKTMMIGRNEAGCSKFEFNVVKFHMMTPWKAQFKDVKIIMNE